MKREEADKLYTDNWDAEFTTTDALNARIKTLAEAGAYEMCVRIDSAKQCAAVKADLRERGFSVENHNGYPDILAINWG